MKDARALTNPLARKEGLIIQELPDEVLVYDLETDRAHCLNQTAAFVWQRCDGRTTAVEIARLLGKRAGAKIDERIVWLALDQLGENELLTRRPIAPAALTGLDRRQMMRTLGLAAPENFRTDILCLSLQLIDGDDPRARALAPVRQ